MLPGRIRSSSEPLPSIGGRTSIEAKKTASVPDLHGKLTTSAGIVPLRLTEPLKLSRPASDVIPVCDGNQQISDHQAELVPAIKLGQGAQGNPPGTVPGATAPEPFILPESNRLSPGLRVESLPVGKPGENPSGASITGTSEPISASAKTSKKTAGQKKPARSSGSVPGPVEKDITPKDRSKSVAEVKRLVSEADLRDLKQSGGDLKKLAGARKSSHGTTLAADNQLSKTFRDCFNRLTKGGKEFPPDFNDKLSESFDASVNRLGNTKNSPATATARPVKRFTIDKISGLQDMFKARAVNHLITGELHMLDPMIGDEGCQIRAPFILDMHRLVQEKMPKNAVDLIRHYRDKTDSEQTRAIEQLRGLEVKRTNQDRTYDGDVSGFVNSNPLEESERAKTGEYEAMFADLTKAIEKKYPKAIEYLSYTCSEGSIYWEDVLDPFGLSMLTDRHPVFPNTMLAGRKMEQSKLSKDYLVRSTAELVRKDGGIVNEEEKHIIGFDKTGKLQTSSPFFSAQSKKGCMPAMFLHALQLHSGAAVTKKKRQLELMPYWETTRLALTHALKNGYPLIVNIRRLAVSGEGDNRQYSSNICKTLFYEPTDKGYQYQPHPSAEQQSQGALLFQGYSMLRQGDTDIPGATVPIAPWVFKENPEEFLDGFTKCDVANLMLLGDVGTHHPLNTGDGSFAYGPPEGQAGVYSFANDPGGWRYVDAIHDRTLADLGVARMTQKGQEYLTPEFGLTDKSKGMTFPDECPVKISGATPEFNIKEEYQLIKQLGQAAGMKETMYSKEHKDGTAERIAQSTMPFVSTHILASTFVHEDEVSRRFSSPKTRGVSEKLDELSKK